MKIAVPVNNNMLSPHFGHCEKFAIIETDAGGSIISSEELTPPPHEPGVLPAWLGELGVEVIIAGGMGQRAQMLFAERSILVVCGAMVAEAEVLVREYLSGTLQTGTNLCDH